MRANHKIIKLICAAAVLCGAASSASAQKGLAVIAEESKTLAKTFEGVSDITAPLAAGLKTIPQITNGLRSSALVKSPKAPAGFNRGAEIETAAANAPVNSAQITIEQKDQQAREATFRVYLSYDGKINPAGTASLMSYKDRLIIVTNAHVASYQEEYKEGRSPDMFNGKVILENSGGNREEAFVFAPFQAKWAPSKWEESDIAFLEIACAENNNFLRGIKPLRVAENIPPGDENLRFFGFDIRTHGYLASKQSGKSKTAPYVISMYTTALPGHSGSPVLNQNNEVVGVIYAGGHDWLHDKPSNKIDSWGVNLPMLKKTLDFYISNSHTH